MAEPTTDSFIREVDEELRHEQLKKFWKVYGAYIIGVAVVVVLIVAGYQGWRHWDRSGREAQGAAFIAAFEMAENQRLDEARQAFADLVSSGRGGYALLARFQDAALLADRGDRVGAATAYFEIADDGKADRTYREMATIMGALQGFDDLKSETVRSRLQPLADGNGPWRHSAREILGFKAHLLGDLATAGALFRQIADDVEAPPGVRERANEMLLSLGD